MDIATTPLADLNAGELAANAVRIALDSFNAAFDMSITKRNDLHVVVMNQHRQYEQYRFRDAVLHEESFGERAEWEHPYHLHARSKALVSWRTGLPSRLVRKCMPQLSHYGDTAFWGSVALDGIIVGASGVQSEYDEAVAMSVAAWLRALYSGRDKERLEKGDEFLGGQVASEIDY